MALFKITFVIPNPKLGDSHGAGPEIFYIGPMSLVASTMHGDVAAVTRFAMVVSIIE